MRSEPNQILIEERTDVRAQGSPVHSMAVHEGMGKLVLIRKIESKSGADDVIEQYNALPKWMIKRERVISPANGGIEAITFVGDRIVATHLNGSISICSPHSDAVKRVQVSPTPLWALCAVSGTQAALVSHSAMLYTVNIVEGLIEHQLNIGVEQRLFSVAHHKQIAIGATDAVFIVKENQLQKTLKVPRKEKRLPTIVWCVQFYDHRIVVSGDSRGIVSFWDVYTGALYKELQPHQADVLAMCYHRKCIIASGVDPRIMRYRPIGRNDFQPVIKKGPLRDIKSVATFDDIVFAAGDDHQIYTIVNDCREVCTQYNKLIKINGELSMTTGLNYVDIYLKAKESVTSNEVTVAPGATPQYLARVYTPEKSALLASDLNPEGTMVALSTLTTTTLYSINAKERTMHKLLFEGSSGTCIKFSSTHLFICSNDFTITRINLTTGDTDIVLEQNGCGSVIQMAVQSDSSHAAVITSRCQVFATNIDKGESRLLRADLPIDLSYSTSGSLFVLCSGDETNRKVLFEFPADGGASLRSCSASAFFPRGDYPISIDAGPDDQLLIESMRNRWAIINLKKNEISHPPSNPESKDTQTAQFRADGRLCVCHVEPLPPTTAPYRLKLYGQN